MNTSKKFFLYVIRCADDTFYTGITTDLTRRIHEHNSTQKGAKYTHTRRPVRLIHSEAFADRSSALKAEAAFKKLSRHDKVKKISQSTSTSHT